MRIVFMGSPPFAVPTLQALARAHDVSLVVSQPDRPAGRGQKLVRPAVALAADALGIPTIQPTKVKVPAFVERLAEERADLIVVVAYGRILTPEVLAVPRLVCVNVHASILPRHRGAAPIQWSVISGDAETGVSIMQMDAGLDTGPVFATHTLPIAAEDTAGTLQDKLAVLGAEALLTTLDAILANEAVATAQDDARATLAPRLTKHDGALDFSRPASEVRNRTQGVDPWPGASVAHGAEVLKVFAARLRGAATPDGVKPGTVVAVKDELCVACGDGQVVAFTELQRAGRRRLPARQALAGLELNVGDLLSKPATNEPAQDPV